MTNKTIVDKLIKKIALILAFLIILAAVISSLFRSLTPLAVQYKNQVASRLSQLIGQPVSIESMNTGWYWLEPVLQLHQVKVKNSSNTITIKKLLVGINLFQSLLHWRIQPGLLYVDTAHLVFRKKNGSWQIEGVNNKLSSESSPIFTHVNQLLSLLARQERLIIKNISAQIYLEDGGLIPLRNLDFSVANSYGHYYLKGKAKISQMNQTSVKILANFNTNPYHLDTTEGHFYITARHVLLAQWQKLFDWGNFKIEGGEGSASVWWDVHKGRVDSAQAHVNLSNFAWNLAKENKHQIIQTLQVNLGWQPTQEGWQLSADHLQLRTDGETWPLNQMRLLFNITEEKYSLFIKTIRLDSLAGAAINWPLPIQSLLQLKPSGTLSDTQLIVQQNQPQLLLTRFDQLGWEGNKMIPYVSNLSGVLDWQPQEGHLALDTEHATVRKGGDPVQFDLLNGVFYWKYLSNGLRLNIERVAMSLPQLTISAHGVVDEVSTNSLGAIHLNVAFAAKHLEQWKSLLSKKAIRPKLWLWLTQDIKKIAQATGKIAIHGNSKDFPFDANNGEFSLESYVQGGELLITSKWPLTTDIDGYITVKNRNLNVDLIHADFQGVPLRQMNLRINEIGKNKEVLLLRGSAQGQGQKMMNFVMASPLKQKLAKLNTLTLLGIVGLELNLEIPLYTEDKENRVQGKVTLDNNTVALKHTLGSFLLEEVNGELYFNEQGVDRSNLTATALGYPLQLMIQSVTSPQRALNLRVLWQCTFDALRQKFASPLLSLFKGMFVVNAEISLTDDTQDFDHIHLKSTLKGTAIRLPPPLGKSASTATPVDIKVDFHPQKALRLRGRYQDNLSTDLLFTAHEGGFVLTSGQLNLGNLYAVNQNLPGLAITGSLDGFNLEQWKSVYDQFATKNDSSLGKKIRIIDVKMKQLTFLNQQFNQIAIKAKMLKEALWSFSIYQQKVAGDLTYDTSKNTLSGFIHYLHLDPIKAQSPSQRSTLVPEQIPNLNLRIDDLSIGTIKIGNVTLNSQTSVKRWLINYCKIDSSIYQFLVKGEWIELNDAHQQTKLNIQLHSNDLAKSLAQWDFAPAVDAGNGDIQFQGGWNNSLFNFSLAKVTGTMSLQLKEGRITHLSKEMEEKLDLGKLLSILSLQTIPRRLKLDFSDLANDGYSFDIFKGNFTINNGIMTTNDSYIDGPVAYASMKGDLDLVHRLYDLDLKISPHITASLPVVATIAGGPIAGIATWVASKIISQSMQKITDYSYKISGPWNQPIVQQLSIGKKN